MGWLTTEKVAGESMLPALSPGDWLLVRVGGRVRPGDVVVAYRPDRPEIRLVKRVTQRDADGWWLEGDNQAASTDSWNFGAVPDELIVGRVLLRYRPLPPTRVSRRRAR